MNWVVSSTLMWFSSVISYLLLRRSNILKIPVQINNLVMFLLPFIIYLVVALVGNLELQVTYYELVVIVILSIFFSYLGNVFSLRGMNSAPNPGYSLVIAKSYVVMTSIASIFLFGSELTMRKSIAIIIILLCSAFLTLHNNGVQGGLARGKNWVLLSLGAFLCWGLLSLTSKYLLNLGVDPVTRLFYTMGIASIISTTEVKGTGIKVKDFTLSQFSLLISIGILTALLNYFMQVSYDLAPNIGYVNAINLSSVAGVAVFSAFIYKDELPFLKLLSILGTTIGLIILVT